MLAPPPLDAPVAILTCAGDLHALAVQQEIQDRHNLACVVVETDKLAGSGTLTWSNVPEHKARLPTSDGGRVDVTSLDAVWWRRANFPARIPPTVTDGAHRTLITNDCRTALLGVLLDQFSGRWVSDPLATQRAENKLVQLKIAQDCGLRTPKTLVSQDPAEVRRFCEALDYRVVVKAVRGTYVRPPLTALLDKSLLAEETSLALSPAIYQEYVPGRCHLRVHLFGDEVYTAALESDAVDWRPDMNIPVRRARISEDTAGRLRDVLGRLGLVMGIVDLKVAEDGEPVWLELNAQGQFLFIEGLSGLPLIRGLADFLAAQAKDR